MRSVVLSIACIAMLLAGSSTYAVPSQMSAYETVKAATELLLEKLEEVKGVYAEDPELFYGEVDSALSPYIDFERFARGVMAKYYRTATPEQQHTFTRMFKQDLIRTYAKALVEFDNERIDVLPPGDERIVREDERTVKMEIHGKSGAIYPVEYSMAFKDGEWKLKNVIVNGINIGLAFRKKFAQEMQKNGRDVSRVIDTWNSQVGEGS